MKEALDHAIEQRPQAQPAPAFPALIGNSLELQKIRDKIERVADKDVTVLITGESGTRNELIASSIHYHCSRKRGRLLECDLPPAEAGGIYRLQVLGPFGLPLHLQTGVWSFMRLNKPGRLELADGGTVFIDEIGDLSLKLQVKFPQMLEDKAFSRLGEVSDKIIDAGVVAATNTDLCKMVKMGKFRKDLYYGLNVVHIEAPPLRKRRKDIPLLADYFLNKYCYDLKRDPLDLSAHVLAALGQYAWLGNTRELENMVRRAIVLREWDFDLQLDVGEEGMGRSLGG